MADEIRIDGITVAPGVLETIITLAAQSVDGMAALGAPGLAGLAQKARKGPAGAVSVCVNEDDDKALDVSVHIQIEYGRRLRDVAHAVQMAVADAVTSQVGGVDSVNVDVYVDGIVFIEQA